MRWNDTVTLLSASVPWQDAEGGWHEGEHERRVVFCNRRRDGLLSLANLRSSEVRSMNNSLKVDMGLQVEAQLEIRDCDYLGEDRCEWHGDEMDVLFSTSAGENRVLGIGRRIGDG